MASFQPASHLFERNISLNDLDSALDVRETVRKDVVVPEDVTKHRYLDSSTKHSFVLPSFQDFPIEFRKFVYSFLVDGHILRELEATRRLNWCHSLGRMITVNTLGDGNCLMHAASIGMWAVNDRYQTLRKTAYEALLEDVEGTRFYHGRWKAEEQQQILNQIGGYDRTEEQWNHEWEEVIRLISQTEFPCGPNGAQFGSLAEIHIFVLANILRRSIIVVSDDTLRGPYGDSYSPINFGGIYLPLLWDSVDCVKSPLVIGYADGHFTAVISIEDGKMDLGNENNPGPSSSSNCIHAVPLVKYDGTPLPVHFLYDYEAPLASDRVRQYLDCAKVPFSSNQGQTRQTVLVAKLHFSEQPRCMKELVDGYFRKATEEHQRVSRHSQVPSQLQPGTKQPALQIVQCQTQGCSFYGSTETGNRCSKCLNEFLRTLGPACESSQHVPPGQPIPSPQLVAVTPQQAPNTSAWQHTVTTQAAPNTSGGPSMTLPVARSVKCRTTACKYGALPNGGGLCERCSEAERSAEEMAASMNHMSLASVKHCSNSVNGCEFFGLPEHHNLCSRCYRTFCLNMENTLGVLSPTGLPPSSPTASTPPQCKIQGCLSPGVPALYGMCVQCYTRCIHSFIHSQGTSVGGVTQTRPHQPSPPVDVMRKNQLPTGGRNKGVLCASPGCCNEGIFHLSDLCAQCHARNSTPSSQIRNAAVSTASTVSFPVSPPLQSSVTATAAAASTASTVSFPVPLPLQSSVTTTTTAAAAAAPSHQLTTALTSAIGSNNYCSNPMCPNPRGKDGRGLCQRCNSLNTGSLHANSTASLQQPTRPFGATTASSMPPRQNTPAYSSAMSRTYIYTTSEMGRPYQVTSAQIPLSGANTDKCAMGCGKPAVQEGGLCEQCYAAAYQLELNRQTVSQPSRQQRPVPPRSVTRNQVEQRNIAETSSGRNIQQAEATTAKKKANLLPCPSVGCMQFGSPEKNGLCDDCYRKKGNQQQGASAATGANELQGSNQRWELHNTHTTAENHQFSNSSRGLQGPVQVSQIHSPSCESGMSGQSSSSGNGAFDGQRCRGTNCTLFGTPETNDYCSRCFLESTIPLSYPHSIPDFPVQVSSSSAASCTTAQEKCRVTGCANVAAADRHGHCQKCFTRFYPDVVHREAVVERQMSELAETVN